MPKPFLIIVGKSGSGKTTVADLFAELHGLRAVPTYTTRPMRTPDEEGHTFVSDVQFNLLTDKVAFTTYNGYRYCTTQDQIANFDIAIFDPEGVEYFRTHYKGKRTYFVIYLKCSRINRFINLIKRGSSFRAAIERLSYDAKAFKGFSADGVIKTDSQNSTLRKAVNKLSTIWLLLEESNVC